MGLPQLPYHTYPKSYIDQGHVAAVIALFQWPHCTFHVF